MMHRHRRPLSSSPRAFGPAATDHPLAVASRPRRHPARCLGALSADAGTDVVSGGMHVRTDEMARVEAALFIAREPVSPRRLARLAGLADASRTRAIVRDLRRLHDAAGTAFRVEQIAGGFQMLTRAPLGPWVRRLLDRPPVSRLSAAAFETLAIVAYRQPVTRAEIEAIRGVGSEEIIRQLLERDLVAVGGRADDLGRPNVYVTTARFLAAFGLARLVDLPPVENLAESSAETAVADCPGDDEAGG